MTDLGSEPIGVPRQPRPSGARRAGLFLLAFASGFAVLSIEIAGARLIAPVFGLSAVPWTALIGVILAALALGSHFGGRLADGGVVPLSWILAASAGTAVLPILGRGLPWIARDVLGFIPGAVASAIFLFAPAVLCLGAVVPFLVQADTENLGRVGRRAGDMSATATAGSIAGTFVTGFVLLPLFPVTVLLSLTAVALLGMAALSGAILGGRVRMGLVLVAATGMVALGAMASRPDSGTLRETQTLYAAVSVTESDWEEDRPVIELWQNGGSSSAEEVGTGDPAHLYVAASALLLEPVIDRVESMLVLGGAALSLPVAFSRWRPEMRIDVVEIDPVVTALATEFFAYGRDDYPSIRVFHDDARMHLRGSQERFDVIYLDVFDHLMTVPWTMVTREALTEFSDHLEPDGLFVANILSPLDGPGTAFLERFRATLDQVFGGVVVYPADETQDAAVVQNLIVIASRRLADLPVVDWPRAGVGPNGRAFTDDWAPVELLQAKMLLKGGRRR